LKPVTCHRTSSLESSSQASVQVFCLQLTTVCCTRSWKQTRCGDAGLVHSDSLQQRRQPFYRKGATHTHTHIIVNWFAGRMWKNNSKRYTQPPILFHNFYSVYIIHKHGHGPHNTTWLTVGWRPMLHSVEEKYQHSMPTSCFHVHSRSLLLCWTESQQDPPQCWHLSIAQHPLSGPYLYSQIFCWKSLNSISISTSEMPNKFIMT
jgi:hypothetical protein